MPTFRPTQSELLSAQQSYQETVSGLRDSYQSARETVFNNVDNLRSLSDAQDFLKNNSELFNVLGNDDIAEIQKIFKSKTSDFTQSALEDLELRNSLDELDPQNNESEYLAAAQQGQYLPNRVSGNILDKYHTPNYHIRLFMIDKQKVIEMHNTPNDDPKNTIGFDIALQDPSNEVVIAQTGVTDLTIDNLNLEHFNNDGTEYDVNKNRSVATTVTFDITEPGSVSFLDRLAAAKVYCGYTETIVDTAEGQSLGLSGSTDPSQAVSSNIPFYLEITFKGYPDETIDDAPNNKPSDPHMIGRPFVYELGYLKFDMEITPEGSTYHCSAHIMDNVAQFKKYHTFQTEIVISGGTITELLEALQRSLNNQLTTENNTEGTSGSTNTDNSGNTTDDTLSKAKTEYIINYEDMFYKKDFKAGEGDNPDNAQDQRTTTGRYLDRIYIDPDRVTPINFADAPESYQTKFADRFGGQDAPTKPQDSSTFGSYTPPDGLAGGDIFLDDPLSGDQIANTDISQLDERNMDRVRTILSDKSSVSLRFPKGNNVQDALITIMGLSYDFMQNATRLKDLENPEKGVDMKKTFVGWFTIGNSINFDYSKFDPKKRQYKARVEYSLLRVQSPRTDIGLTSSCMAPLTNLEIVTDRITELKIQKEYLYMFTGLNDQIKSLDLKFDEAFALRVPYYGLRNPVAQLAYAHANSKTLDEAEKENPLLTSPNEKQKAEAQKATIIDFLNDVKSQIDSGKDILQTAIGNVVDGSTGSGFTREFVESALSGQNAANEDALVEAIAADEVFREAINQELVRNRIASQTGTPTESDTQESTQEEDERDINIPVFSSQLVPGLEGPGDDSRIAERFASFMNAQEVFDSRALVSGATSTINVDTTSTNQKSYSQAVERGSIRAMAFSHLMSQHAGASSSMQLVMEIRGDPWWWGKKNFYDLDKTADSNEYISDLEGAYADSGGPVILLMIESPRKLDFNVDDEDANTGLYNFGHLNYTMSGVYRCTRCESTLANGEFYQTLSLVKAQEYDVSKIEQVSTLVQARIDEWADTIQNTDGGAPGTLSGVLNSSGIEGVDMPTGSDLLNPDFNPFADVQVQAIPVDNRSGLQKGLIYSPITGRKY